MKDAMADITRPLRHKLVELLAPNLWKYIEDRKGVPIVCERGFRSPSPMIKYVKMRFREKPLVGAEIGVAGGAGSLSMLKLLNISRLYLIDPYIPYVEDGSDYDYSREERKAKLRLRDYLDRVLFLKESSNAAVKDVVGPLDFVYIDGDHNYEQVREDIANYYQMVRSGGVLGGHDFEALHLGVIRAVIHFVEEKRLQLHTLKKDWWVTKP